MQLAHKLIQAFPCYAVVCDFCCGLPPVSFAGRVTDKHLCSIKVYSIMLLSGKVQVLAKAQVPATPKTLLCSQPLPSCQTSQRQLRTQAAQQKVCDFASPSARASSLSLSNIHMLRKRTSFIPPSPFLARESQRAPQLSHLR